MPITTHSAYWVDRYIKQIPIGYRRLSVGEIIPEDAFFWNVYYDAILNDTKDINLWTWHDPAVYGWYYVDADLNRILVDNVAAFIVKIITPKGNTIRSLK